MIPRQTIFAIKFLTRRGTKCFFDTHAGKWRFHLFFAGAYFKRVKKPSLNDQWDHKAFKVAIKEFSPKISGFYVNYKKILGQPRTV